MAHDYWSPVQVGDVLDISNTLHANFTCGHAIVTRMDGECMKHKCRKFYFICGCSSSTHNGLVSENYTCEQGITEKKTRNMNIVPGQIYPITRGYMGASSLSSDGDLQKSTVKKDTIMIKKLGTILKKLVDGDTQKLLKAGLLNGDLELTGRGHEELLNVLFFANKEAMVARADEMIAEDEEASKK